MKIAISSSACLLALGMPSLASGQIRIVSYNTETAFNAGGNPNAGLQNVLQGIGNESVSGFAKRVDLLCLQEQNNTNGNTTTSQILTMMNNLYGAGTYAKGSLISGATSTPNPDSSALIYDQTKFTLVNEVLVGTATTSGMARQEIRYQLRPVGYGANADFYVYVGHWKANGSQEDMDRRNVEAQTIRGHVNTSLPAGSRVIYTGDFNLTGGTSEDAWNTMTAPGNGQGIDPFNGSWANVAKTWSSTSLGSRLDFQMQTAPTTDGHGLSLINGTYRTFGNNGTTPNGGAATHGSNTALPGLPNRSTVLSSLTTSSDHYPVVADYRYPAKMSASLGAVPGTVIVGANVPVNLTVTNTAPVVVAAGADGLDYNFSGTGAVAGSGSATGLLALSAGNTHALAMDTSTPGPRSGSVSVTGTSQEVANGSFAQNVNTTVLAHANGSFAPGVDQDALTIDFGIRARGSSPVTNNFAIHNLADASGFTAGLDLDTIEVIGDTTAITVNFDEFTNLAAGASQAYATTLGTASVGIFSATYTIHLSDQDLPGATALTSLSFLVSGRVALGGDANLDNLVNVSDFTALAGNFGMSGRSWTQGDFTADGLVNVSDFTILAGNFGLSATGPDGTVTPGDWANLAAAVPEPTTSLLFLSGLAASATRGVRRRRRNAH